jgi:hypothetical protein
MFCMADMLPMPPWNGEKSFVKCLEFLNLNIMTAKVPKDKLAFYWHSDSDMDPTRL